MTVDIICADAREALARFPDGHFHCCVTSPPFWGLRDYGLEPTVWGGDGCEHEWGKPIAGQSQSGSLNGSTLDGAPPGQERRPQWTSAFCRRCNAWRGTLGLEPTPELYVEHLVGVMREVRRVLRPDGTLWLNLGDSYCSSPRGNGPGDYSTSSLTNPQRQDSLPRPSYRRDRRPREDDPHRAVSGLKPKDLVGVPWMVAFALRADGWWLRSDIVWSKPNPMPESVRDRPTRSHEYLFLLTKQERYYYDQDAIREPLAPASIERISQPTFDEQTGGPKDYRTTGVNRHRSARQGLEGLAKRYRSGNKERKLEVPTRPNDHRGSSVPWEDDGQGRNRRSVWEIATQPFPGAHFAVFPEKLVEPCILAGCPEGGIVLDPFSGSGTVGVVAERLGRHSALIDAKEEYCEMARHRTAQRGLMVEAAS